MTASANMAGEVPSQQAHLAEATKEHTIEAKGRSQEITA
jgi:hypothetical protein